MYLDSLGFSSECGSGRVFMSQTNPTLRYPWTTCHHRDVHRDALQKYWVFHAEAFFLGDKSLSICPGLLCRVSLATSNTVPKLATQLWRQDLGKLPSCYSPRNSYTTEVLHKPLISILTWVRPGVVKVRHCAVSTCLESTCADTSMVNIFKTLRHLLPLYDDAVTFPKIGVCDVVTSQ